ncbi:MAG: DUF1015 domain-containing protein [Desulfobacterales bacterium]
MAEVIPFRGMFYNPDKVNNLADVITPPFDVISDTEQEVFYARSPFNVVRLILGKASADDTPSDNPHSRAADYLQSWLTDRLLVRDSVPAFYLTTLDFVIDKRPVTRAGLIAVVRLAPFDAGVILPHERTFTNVKSERLALMKACHANFSPIFAMVPDDDGEFINLTQHLSAQRTPDIAFRAHDGFRHKLWRIVDSDSMLNISSALQSRKLYIADGHHRYETALNYRNWVHAGHPNLSDRHPANFVMMYLSSMADPGLVIRPAHRMLRDVPSSAIDRLLVRAKPYFEIETISYCGSERDGALERFIGKLNGNGGGQSIGMAVKDRRAFYCLTLNNSPALNDLFGLDCPGPLRQLDVTVLTRLIFTEFLEFDQARLDNETLIDYTTDAREAVGRVDRGDFDACFILNPTSVEQVRDVADHGLVMPRKATYFYPKVITGLVINPLTS